MMRFGILEDEANCREQLREYLNQFKSEKDERFSITFFENGEDFIESYQEDFDLLILDIQLGGIDGMEVARRVRRMDENVIILFITAMPQYAIQGYLVSAMGYMLKPISYFEFSEALIRAIRRIREYREGFLVARTREGMLHIPYRDITYIETQGRRVCIHTVKSVHECSMKMRELEAILPPDCFFRCHNCYLVNLRHVYSVDLCEATVNQDRVAVSRLKKNAFMQALASYGGNEAK
ncbi:MAG: LytTR family DNA-binding domain-containing protein [Clostridia bacterium]|nr:LytTR family DNA-binding domain-containing protein [Clostridia bacterium]